MYVVILCCQTASLLLLAMYFLLPPTILIVFFKMIFHLKLTLSEKDFLLLFINQQNHMNTSPYRSYISISHTRS